MPGRAARPRIAGHFGRSLHLTAADRRIGGTTTSVRPECLQSDASVLRLHSRIERVACRVDRSREQLQRSGARAPGTEAPADRRCARRRRRFARLSSDQQDRRRSMPPSRSLRASRRSSAWRSRSGSRPRRRRGTLDRWHVASQARRSPGIGQRHLRRQPDRAVASRTCSRSSKAACAASRIGSPPGYARTDRSSPRTANQAHARSSRQIRRQATLDPAVLRRETPIAEGHGVLPEPDCSAVPIAPSAGSRARISRARAAPTSIARSRPAIATSIATTACHGLARRSLAAHPARRRSRPAGPPASSRCTSRGRGSRSGRPATRRARASWSPRRRCRTRPRPGHASRPPAAIARYRAASSAAGSRNAPVRAEVRRRSGRARRSGCGRHTASIGSISPR